MSDDRGARRLPRPVRWLLLALVAAVIVVLLFTVVFPIVERYLEDPTLDAHLPSSAAAIA